MAEYNKTLLGRESEGSKLEFAISFKDWAPGGTTSDLVRDGVYEAMVVSAVPKPNKRGDGLNLMVVMKITGPKCEEVGKQLVAYHPIPQGDLDSPENQKRRFINSLFWSCVCAIKGDAIGEGLKNAGITNLTPGWFEGKRCYIKVRESTDQNGRPVGEINFYQSKGQYDSNPGPFGGVTDVPIGASAEAAISSPVKTETKTEAKTEAPKTEAAKASGSANPIDAILGA